MPARDHLHLGSGLTILASDAGARSRDVEQGKLEVAGRRETESVDLPALGQKSGCDQQHPVSAGRVLVLESSIVCIEDGFQYSFTVDFQVMCRENALGRM
jgi:hypothetical protein